MKEDIEVSKDMQAAGFVYKPICLENMSDELKKKLEIARKITTQTNVWMIDNVR